MQHILSQQSGQQLRVGRIGDADGRILLVRENEHWVFPSSDHMGTRKTKTGLYGVLDGLGVSAESNFLYAVFDGPAEGQLSICYRGEIKELNTSLEQTARLFSYAEIPWDQFPMDAYRSMLNRYLDERRRFQFGVYVGTSETGHVVKHTDSD